MVFKNQILGFAQQHLLRRVLFGAFCVVTLLFAGCGQKGPLFLPTVPVAATLPAAPAATATLPATPASAAR
jgi:predicted small lipoprotein YifL